MAFVGEHDWKTMEPILRQVLRKGSPIRTCQTARRDRWRLNRQWLLNQSGQHGQTTEEAKTKVTLRTGERKRSRYEYIEVVPAQGTLVLCFVKIVRKVLCKIKNNFFRSFSKLKNLPTWGIETYELESKSYNRAIVLG